MNQITIDVMFAVLRSAVTEKPMTDTEREQFSKEMLPDLMALAQKHDLAHLVGYGAYKNKLLAGTSEYYAKIQQSQVMAVFRYEQLNYEFERLCETFEEAEIPFIPLKGSVLRKYYPEQWMRTSCDIDVLVQEENLDKAAAVLVEKCGYDRKALTSHDISLYSSAGQHIELHYTLIEDRYANSAADILNDVWKHTVLKEEKNYWYEMTDEMFYFYHVSHMAKHFVSGGCGIRPLIDLWILDQLETDRSKRKEILAKSGLLQFTEAAGALSRCWMEDAAYDPLTQQMEDFILRGGVYGTVQNRIVLQQQKKGGRLQYAVSKFFLPYDVIKFQYPILLKHRWLTPFMEVRRWCRLAFCGHAKRSIRELKYNNSISPEQALEMKAFLENIGL